MNVLYKTEAANMRNLTRKEPETPGTVKIESSHGVKPRLCRRDPEDSWHWGASEPFIMPPHSSITTYFLDGVPS
ncbi:hypothetical protein PABG_05372 [Paracoccidioides brasiliensis Pb03]|nr:hypothetical protein PABG_05372 [Paracoccidioides brasiliensis Pb03]